MARFYFHLHDGMSFLDKEGIELGSWKEALKEAVRCAGDMIGDRWDIAQLGERWAMEVTDKTGHVLFRLQFELSDIAGAAQS